MLSQISFKKVYNNAPFQFHIDLFYGGIIKMVMKVMLHVCCIYVHLQKKALSEVFAMARVGKDVWTEFEEINTLYEKGGLKDQKVNSVDVMRGIVNMKQWHMKPLSNLSDEQRLSLLRKVK